MKYHIDIIDGIKDICIIVNKGIVSDEETCFVTNKYKTLLNEMDEAYRCIRSLIVDDNLIEKIELKKKRVLWIELKLPVTPSTQLLEDHTLNQISYIEGGIPDNTTNHTERNNQVGKRVEGRYQCVIDFTQS